MAYNAQDNTEASKLNGSSLRIGATLTLKVMAGDKIDLGVNAWYPGKENGDDDKASPQDVAASLLKILSGSTAAASGGHITAEAAGATTSPLLSGIMDFLSSHPENLGDPHNPAAYINRVLFDESLNYVPAGSGFIKVGTFSDDMQTLAQEGIVVPQSGYLFIYLSNETEHYDVFFDNIMANHTPSAILEETHYYPFGLTMAGISSQAAGGLTNKDKFNGKELNNQEFSDGSGLELYDFGARMHDPQIGRWFTIDPLADKMRRHSPYNYCFDNPIRFVDPDGMGPTDWYRNNYTGNITWFDGSRSHIGYENVGKSGSFNSYTEYNGQKSVVNSYRLCSDGAAYDGDKLVTGGGTITTGAGHIITTNPNSHLPYHVDQEPDRQGGGGVAFTSESGDGGAPHVAPENRNLNNQQTENVDMLLLSTGRSDRMGPIERPDPTSIWEWNKQAASLPIDGNRDQSAIAPVIPTDQIMQTTQQGVDPMFLKKGNVIYHRDGGYTTKQDGKGGGQISHEPATDTFPKQKSFGYQHPY